MKIQDKIYKYFELNARLHVLFIFEGISMISDSLKECVWREDYLFKIFDGDWFNTKYKLENDWKEKKSSLCSEIYPCLYRKLNNLNFP